MTYVICNARVYCAETRSFVEGCIQIDNGTITAMGVCDMAAAEVFDAEGAMIIPGLVDVHTHGRAGGDWGSAEGDALACMAASYLQSGVTTVLPTLASAPLDELHAAIDRICTLAGTEDTGLPYLAGIHLEGRYLNVAKRGAHAPELLAPLDPNELEELLVRMEGARHISAALELDKSGDFLRRALALGATVSLGHSAATYEEASDLFSHGVSALTHTFNALPPLHHRDGGAVAAALLSDTTMCELICDGFHIAPEMVKLAYRLAGERLVLITDSMEATGCPDGEYAIAGMPVTVKDGKARTHDGAIAGSTLSMWQAVQNLQAFAGASFEDAIYAATMAPAREVQLDKTLGSLSVGKRADLLVMSDQTSIRRVMCGGIWIK